MRVRVDERSVPPLASVSVMMVVIDIPFTHDTKLLECHEHVIQEYLLHESVPASMTYGN